MKKLPFCTCKDTSCHFNPVNHEHGCDLCVAKCLKENEIPSCFFHKIAQTLPDTNYTFQGFAEFVQKHL